MQLLPSDYYVREDKPGPTQTHPSLYCIFAREDPNFSTQWILINLKYGKKTMKRKQGMQKERKKK
jgi:hypothetical protein